MLTIEKEIKNSIIINKSEFITFIKPIDSVDKAKQYLDYLKKEYSDATHHVCGYIIGKTAETAHFTDDGEPSGTAGLPIFEVLRKNNLTNIVFDCIRYFGGIKLGAGGLVRAYSKSISEIIKMANLIDIIDYTYFFVITNYNYLKLIDLNFSNYIYKRIFSHNVELFMKVPSLDFEHIVNSLQNLTQNTSKIEILPSKDVNILEND